MMRKKEEQENRTTQTRWGHNTAAGSLRTRVWDKDEWENKAETWLADEMPSSSGHSQEMSAVTICATPSLTLPWATFPLTF